MTFEDRSIAFVDILGFTSIIDRLANDPCLHHRLHQALLRIKSEERLDKMPNSESSDLQVSVFSDSVVISVKASAIPILIYVCGYLQADLLRLGIATRGGIVVGKTYHKGGLLYGVGMIAAYQIEKSAAVYPRIVLDPEIIAAGIANRMSRTLRQDSDGLWYIDAFMFCQIPPSSEELAAEGYDPRDEYFEDVSSHIADNLAKAKELSPIAKWNWLAKKLKESWERRPIEMA